MSLYTELKKLLVFSVSVPNLGANGKVTILTMLFLSIPKIEKIENFQNLSYFMGI